MTIRAAILSVLVVFSAILAGCGDDSLNAEQADYERALYMAYATAKTGEPMNNIAISDLMVVSSRLITLMQQYYLAEGNLPASIDLSNPPASIKASVPTGMTGTITGDVATLQITAHLSLANCAIESTKSYTGTLNAVGVFDISAMNFSTLQITAPNLKITYSGSDYKTATFSSYVLGYNNADAYADYTLSGGLSVDASGYSFSSLSLQKSSSTALTLSGVLSFSGSYMGVSGSVTLDAVGNWSSGTITLTAQDDSGTVEQTATVTVNGTTASFQITDGDAWEKDDWYTDRLVP